MPPKPLSDFPRPPDDNGRGVHWSARVYHPTGDNLRHWIAELQAMQMKWIKLLDDGGGSSIELCRALLDNGMMPVVRIFRERPNPGSLSGREIDAVQRLVRAGVSYIEANNEPDLPAEWQDNHKPDNWLDIVVDNFIIDASIVLNAGGLPAVPAMGPGSKDDVVRRVAERGRTDIFENGAWVAIHNYTLNHPLDYPYDEVNQTGKPITVEEFEELARWQYSHLSPAEAEARGVSRDDYFKFQRWGWDGRNIDMVNELRAERKNPGDTLHDDANCFLAWKDMGQAMFEVLGYHLPILSTEGGPVVGWGDDRRYAKVNPTTQAQWQLEIFRILQEEAPEWYFTCCTWLIASLPLGDFSPTWDQMSWYTHAWDLQFGLKGQLPIVQMLKDTPAQPRRELRQPDDTWGAVTGTATGRDGQPVAGLKLMLKEVQGDELLPAPAGKIVAQATSDSAGQFTLKAPAGVYDLHVEWVGPAVRAIVLHEGQTDAVDLADMDPPGAYRVEGRVRDTSGRPVAGANVELRRGGLVHATTKTDAAGAFAFSPGVAGEYVVTAPDGGGSARVGPGQPQATVQITVPIPPTPRYIVTEKRLLPLNETGNRRMFYGRVTNAEGDGLQNVEMEMRWSGAAPGAHFPRTRTGRDPFKPEGYYEFLHSPGEFAIHVVQGDYESETADQLLTFGVPGREGTAITYEVNFQLRAPQPDTAPAASAVSGRVPGGRVGQALRLRGPIMGPDEGQGETRETTLDANRGFRFGDLPAGAFSLFLAGVGAIRPDLTLDGRNHIDIEFPLLGAIVGSAVGAHGMRPPGASVTLISETHGFTRRAELTADGQYRFTNLPAGVYRIEWGERVAGPLVCDGASVLQAPPLAGPGVEPPGPASISGHLLDQHGEAAGGVVVILLREGAALAQTATDAAGSFSFADLQPGSYALAVFGEVLARDLELEGGQDLQISLQYAPSAAPARPLARYYLLSMSNPALTPALVRMIAPWLASQPAGVVGFSAHEAKQAAVVVVLGDGISDDALTRLTAAGCQVEDRRSGLLALGEALSIAGA